MKLLKIITIFFTGIFASMSAFAICPLCTIAVGAGIGLSQYLGIDDTITGIWTGGLTMSFVIWTINWLNKKNIHFIFRKLLVAIVYYGFTIFPLYTSGVIGHVLNKLWGMDKMLLGVVIGSIAFLVGNLSYEHLKKKHHNKAYFPFQKVVMPVAPLIILSVIFYFIVK